MFCGWHACQGISGYLWISFCGDRDRSIWHTFCGSAMCRELSSACSNPFTPRVKRDHADDRVTPAYLEILSAVAGPRPRPRARVRPKKVRLEDRMHSNCSADAAPPLWSGVLLRSQVHLMACLSAVVDRRQINWVGTIFLNWLRRRSNHF